ncbi:MAG: Ig-like domain-containing protein [Firmicutes bacterium]|nr:Ig-like domain-containing protein [Bacillota bacterium]
MARIKKSWFILVLSVILLALLSLPVFAGQGDGTGGGQGVPLRLDSSSPYNGQTGVSLPLLINMTFNKNVINMTVYENNRNCFSLYAADGSKIPVEVIMADDQIEPEKKRDIALRPLQELKPGAAYTVRVSSALQAKSGVNLENDLTITFITANGGFAPGANNNPSPQNAGSPPPAGSVEPAAAQTGQGDNSTGAAAGATDGGASAGDSPAAASSDNITSAGPDSSAGESSGQGEAVNSEQPGGSQGSGPAAWILAIAALVLIGAGYVISRRKK